MIVDYDTVDYKAAKQIREEELREPLGLSLTEDDVLGENKQIHFCAFDGEKVVGTAILALDGKKYRLRQVAVAKKYQGKHVGEKLLQSCENYAKKVCMDEIYCNARQSVENFYKKNGFAVQGDVFIEKTLPHVLMTKKI